MERTDVQTPVDVDGLVAAAVERAISEQGELGVQVAAYHDGELVVDVWAGIADEASGRPVEADSIFNAFSVTKAVTATALHMLAARGFIDYDAPISRYWPEFAANGKGDATVLDALTHRTGIPQMPEGSTPERMCDWEWMVREVAALEPLFPPGTKSAYHGYTFGWIVGELVRRTDPEKRPVDRFVAEEICDPLGIESLWLGIPDDAEERVATLRDDTRRLPADVDPQSLSVPQRVAALAIPGPVRSTPENFMRPDMRRACLPGMGVIADARSVARFFAMLANGGELAGVRLLQEDHVRSFCTRLPSIPGDEFDLGDKVVGRGAFHLPVPMGQTTYYHAIGSGSAVLSHSGSGGQLGWADLDTRLAVAILHNRMFSPHSDPAADPLVTIANAVRDAAGVR